MTKRTFITKSGDEYTWEETDEVRKALAALHQHQRKEQEQQVPNN